MTFFSLQSMLCLHWFLAFILIVVGSLFSLSLCFSITSVPSFLPFRCLHLLHSLRPNSFCSDFVLPSFLRSPSEAVISSICPFYFLYFFPLLCPCHEGYLMYLSIFLSLLLPLALSLP